MPHLKDPQEFDRDYFHWVIDREESLAVLNAIWIRPDSSGFEADLDYQLSQNEPVAGSVRRVTFWDADGELRAEVSGCDLSPEATSFILGLASDSDIMGDEALLGPDEDHWTPEKVDAYHMSLPGGVLRRLSGC